MIKDDYGYFSPFLTNSLESRLTIHPQHPSMICRILTPGGPKNRFYNKCWGLVDTPVHKTPCLTIK